MNCEEYKEAIAADPSESFEGGAVHAAACEACKKFRDEMRAFDSRIAAALAIDVPPLNMQKLVEESGSEVVDFSGRRPGRPSLPGWLGIAAGVAVAGFLALRFLAPDLAHPSLAEQVIAHMEHEQESRRVTSVAVPEQELHQVIDPEVSSLDAGMGLVTYANSCVIDGKTVPHLVIQGKSGPVTLILMADETVDAAIPLAGEHVYGVIVPVGSGSVAIIGERSEQLEEIDQIGERIVDSVKWQV